MLTRIEIDGFKSFEKAIIDLDPFTVILGANASGKSNLFDAIQFLAHLATSDIRSAARAIRGESYDLFRRTARDEFAERIHVAVELLLDPQATDPWGHSYELAHTRFRYEVEIARVQDKGNERMILASEDATPILQKKDAWKPFGKEVSPSFRQRFFRYSRKSPLLETLRDGNGPSLKIHQDGHPGRNRPAPSAEATVLSGMTNADFPHLFAIREELRSWKLLQLDPASLRKPSPFLTNDSFVLSDGSNLAAVLYRIQQETRRDDLPKGILPRVIADLATVIPGVVGLDVSKEPAAKEYRVELEMRDGIRFPTAVVSDGTLRVLALLTLLSDPNHRGLVCFEEPENGIHPARLKTLIQHLAKNTTDPRSTDGPNSLAQLILNSHSPVVLSALRPRGPGKVPLAGMIFADTVGVTAPGSSQIRRKTRMRPVQWNDQGDLLQGIETHVSSFEVDKYLATVDREA